MHILHAYKSRNIKHFKEKKSASPQSKFTAEEGESLTSLKKALSNVTIFPRDKNCQ